MAGTRLQAAAEKDCLMGVPEGAALSAKRGRGGVIAGEGRASRALPETRNDVRRSNAE